MQFKANYFALFILAGCATPANYVCSTRCGIHLRPGFSEDVKEGWTCGALQEFEDNLVHAVAVKIDRTKVKGRFTFKPDATEAEICESIGGARGVEIYLQQVPDFYAAGMQVAGITQCDFHSILIGKGATPADTSLAHEMMHWFQFCHWDNEAFNDAVSVLPEALLACLAAEVDAGTPGSTKCFDQAAWMHARLRQSGYHGYWDEIGVNEAISYTNELSKKGAIK